MAGKEHNHSHHDHSHSIALTNVNSAFIIGIVLNFLFVIIEVIIGLSVNSLSLLSDAGHNLADVGSLAISLLAYRLLKVKSNQRYTYGYRKTSILASLLNATILLISIGAIAYEAFHRFFRPAPLPGKTIALVAGIGIVINFGSALLFRKNKEKDLNIKAAYMHLMSDALVSLGLLFGGIIIFYTNWFWLDPVLSILIAIIILAGTWGLLKDSLRLSLDGVPKDIDLEEIKRAAYKVNGVDEIHHIHVWAMSTTENAMTGHIVIENHISMERINEIKEQIRHELKHMNIQHITLETEFTADNCEVSKH
jgi:cobalt-zinc-cadmium efflux system protein